MTTITSAVSNFMYRRSAERVETEEPDAEALSRSASDTNSLVDEDGEEGEFLGTTTTSTSVESRSIPSGTISSEISQRTPILEALPDDEDVNGNGNGNHNNDDDIENTGDATNEASSETALAPGAETATTAPRRRTARGFTLTDLEEEREIVQRRTGGCVLIAGFILLRLWIEAVISGDFGLLLLCLVFTSWTARFVRYNREREEELNRIINEWDETSEDEPAVSDFRLRRMTFQSQLALAMMQSQIQMMEGGHGHPDGGENRPGVGEDAKRHWDGFEYKSVASLTQRGDYGSVVEEKSGATKNIDEEPTCSICLCEYEKGDKLVSLPCKHVFHADCITSWTDNNTRCPLCNADLKSTSGNEIV
jgi:hypothetical protein